MIRVENVNKTRGKFKLEDISFELKEGYIMGLIGPNGSGKTTLIKMLLGLTKSDSGEIKIFDKDIFEDEIYIKDNIGFVFDNLNFYSHLSVKDFKKIVSKAYSKFDSNLFDSYLWRFGIHKKLYIGELSKGEEIKLMIANALSHDAKLLILDEPTAGLDPIVRKDILKLLQQEIENGKRSVIISTHITSDLDGIADYITFINKGKLIFSQDMEWIKERYRIFRGSKEELEESKLNFISIKETKYYTEGLFINRKGLDSDNISIPNLEDVMFHYVKGEK
ncbi:ABC transporter multidrug-family ATP-binding protein [Clostridium sartagoforme AAU1]|uniref:ABC transporter multidrug-family ATP-binding protein n=1 Tax=Clostridium sartagoforme AAU1 TaxID=1202534 RepID=R9BTL3_9CLOT|nr:ABC transporter ATP-binding protein [Clostridium sartagoforme]EOR20060.1 ABC transporter multidrug-family ATP-binding protein [Clostridium sartagoforme AAU1]